MLLFILIFPVRTNLRSDTIKLLSSLSSYHCLRKKKCQPLAQDRAKNFASHSQFSGLSDDTKNCLKEAEPTRRVQVYFHTGKRSAPYERDDEWCSCIGPELTRSNTNNPAAGQCLQIEPLDFIASRDEPLEARSPLAPRPLVPIRSQWFARPVCYYIRPLTRPSRE